MNRSAGARAAHRGGSAAFTNALRAFTLIELLVVIAIIAILAAILFPVFAQAREKARQTACLSNMKQVGMGLMMYTQDFDETLPGNSEQATAENSSTLGFLVAPNGSDRNRLNIVPRDLQPYVKNIHVFHCPSVPDRTNAPGYANPAPNGANSSYLYNGIVMWRALNVIPNPADTIFLHEHDMNMCYVQEVPCLPNFVTNIAARPNQTFIRYNWGGWDNVHNRGGNYVFCDGHVKWQKKSGTRFAQFGAETGTGAEQVSPTRTLADDGPNGNAAAVAEGALRFRAAF